MLETDALKEKLEMEIHRFARPEPFPKKRTQK